MKDHDALAIVALVMADSVSDVESSSPNDGWSVQYAEAIQRSIEQHDHTMLIRLIALGEPIHPAFLPMLADALRAMTQGARPGKPSKLIGYQKQILVADLERRAKAMGSLEAAVAHAANELGMSIDTVRRIWKARGKA